MNKKGFTLIELLAVIVILAIIALIVTPLVLNVIDTAKKGAFESTSYGIIDSAEQGYALKSLSEETPETTVYLYANKVQTKDSGNIDINYKGSKPDSGTLVINDAGKVALAFYQDGICVTKGYTDVEITSTKTTKEACVIPENVPKLYKDTVLNGSDPILDDGMIPIYYDGSVAKKADINSEWYNYTNQEWANAVLVSSAKLNDYKNATAGTTITESDVLAYLVWVPRYKYKLFNVASATISATEIEVTFENVSDAKSTGTTNGTYLTHPAFTFGTEELSGIWVAKFQTSGTTTNPTIKPDVAVIRSIDISTSFNAAKLFSGSNYNLTNVDSHMMKNTEWGAVAYLSQSIYGKYGNTMYTGANKAIYQNKDSGYVTGKSNGTPSSTTTNTQCSYNDVTDRGSGTGSCGGGASTTGNIYGIYDMNGAAYEVVMGAMYNSDNTTIMINSTGFTQATVDSSDMSKYLDKYKYGTTYNDVTAYNRRILGDATGETVTWYGGTNGASFPSSTLYAWFNRGGAYSRGTDSSIFYFGISPGNDPGNSRSFRNVIINQNS